jgi:plastocyanin
MHRLTRKRIAIVVLLVSAAMLGAAVAALVAAGATASTRITVTEREYHLTLSSKTFKPGTVTFVVQNRGKLRHAFAIRGRGLSRRIPGTIRPGGHGTLVVHLSGGTYTVFCPIHVRLGMKTSIHSSSAMTTTGGTSTWG